MTKTTTLFFFLTILSLSCVNEPIPPVSSTGSTPITDSSDKIATTNSPEIENAILIFKKEQEMRIWGNGKIIQTNPVSIDLKHPIGIFDGQQSTNGLQVNFPNEFYKTKDYNVTFDPIIDFKNIELKTVDFNNIAVYIFPNDAKNGQQFVPDFSSPHWMAELYAKMKMELREFN